MEKKQKLTMNETVTKIKMDTSKEREIKIRIKLERKSDGVTGNETKLVGKVGAKLEDS